MTSQPSSRRALLMAGAAALVATGVAAPVLETLWRLVKLEEAKLAER